MAWAGFDTVNYPGDGAMRYLWDRTPLTWTGFRLGPSVKSPDASWMKSYAILADQGWGVAPIYVGPRAADYDAGHVDPAQAAHDADEAATLAGDAGLPPGSTLYLDHDGEMTEAAPLGYID